MTELSEDLSYQKVRSAESCRYQYITSLPVLPISTHSSTTSLGIIGISKKDLKIRIAIRCNVFVGA